MREQVLKDFLTGNAQASTLKKELVGVVVQTSTDVFEQFVTPMNEELVVTREHLLRLCDAVLEGALAPVDLEPIAFCLVASDHFQIDDSTPNNERVLNTLHDWDSPEINYMLTHATVKKFKNRLLTGENAFTSDDITPQNLRSSRKTVSMRFGPT